MRQYTKGNTELLNKIVCNRCGRKLKLENGVPHEGVFHGEVLWGYFSEKEGERDSGVLCEDCYGMIVEGFALPVRLG
ncbi:MAG: hypothetical protein LUD73_02630, partial [Lachnospiraceae bacterium]|nr:hypothetical protein [Lachnospiraceae bacterium]